MLCDECGKNQAVIHTVQIINGTKTEAHLCQECAKNHPELQMAAMFSPSEAIKSLFSLMEPGVIENEEVCKNCGEAFSEFKDTGLLGCSECYDSFRDKIIPVLRRTHGNVQHAGEVPEEAGENLKKQKKADRLKEQLKEAVAREDFEQAAKLRDEINALRSEE